jgi:DNA-binding transcriptional LysR family regulator
MELRGMELRHLRYFQAVAEAGHITRAAATLGIQQPPLTQQIRALEAEFGLALFRRHPKGVTLTDAGKVLLSETRRILEDVSSMRRRMQSIALGEEGTLRVGFTSSAAAHRFIPEALRVCRSQHPGIELVLTENNAAEITESVAASRLDCGLIRVPVGNPPGLVFKPLLHESAVVALPIDHRLTKTRTGTESKSVSVKQLGGEGLILVRRPGAPGLYANLLALFDRQGLKPRIVAEVDRMMTNLNLVAAGAGVSVVPASMRGTHAHAIAYRDLQSSSALDVPLTAVYRSSDEAGPAHTFITLLSDLASHWRTRADSR